MRTAVIAISILAALSPVSPPAGAALIGPSPYTSTADSPFSPFAGFAYFHLETFDDHLLNTPGVTVSPAGVVTTANSGYDGSVIDQVGLAGGCPAGRLAVPCDTLFGSGATGLTFTFSAAVLGALPNAVGIVWTDGDGPITFEAFDETGTSLGQVVGNHADPGSYYGTIVDDRFYGATHSGGISRIFISNTIGGIEVDHLQYGRRGAVNGVPEPNALVLLGLGLALLALARSRSPRSG